MAYQHALIAVIANAWEPTSGKKAKSYMCMMKLIANACICYRMAPELILQQAYDEKIDMWSLGITIIEMMDRVPPHYLIKDEQELFEIITCEPGPTFTYSYPSIYTRGLVAWLLDHNPQSRPNAKDVLLVSEQ